uniref:sensor histidine kinase n=1 Tax=Actinotalea sp. C106 TaxID=2908644 RepID=UPI00202959FE
GLWRRAPTAALAVAWVTLMAQVAGDVPPLLTQASVALVAYGTARWGRHAVVVAGGLSLPLAVLAGLGVLHSGLYLPAATGTVSQVAVPLGQVVHALEVDAVGVTTVLLATTGLLVIGLPWGAGVIVRSLQRARRSQEMARAAAAREAETAEVALLRSQQAQLAADVHDVVGHSLAVILAQAESGQYLPDDDPARLKRTLSVIATSARASLVDVRDVLRVVHDPATGPGTAQAGDLDDLLAGARRSGHPVVLAETGRPRAMAPDVADVAYRVLQEMLTNALRHGRPGAPLQVDRAWGDELQLAVTNHRPSPEQTDPAPPEPAPGSGQGLPGMRRRLASIGGRLDVAASTTTWTTTAHLPVHE